jgi:Holliday junction resolvase-like predicted endonuclease
MSENKICCSCKKEYPKNKEYFFVKTSKEILASGKIAIYKGFRSNCKKCHGIKGNQRRIKKRCKELDCNVSDYRENWKKQYSETRTIDLISKKELTQGQYNHFMKLIRNGFNINYKEYLVRVKLSKKEKINRLIKIVLSKQKYFTKEDKKLALRMYANNEKERLTDAYVANMTMKCKISELTPEIIETKRNILKLKRELKSNNIKIK